ncbi:SRPBCC family protein [Halococcus sp. PRR34]|uniref:SRPBCC family protein n=1 Tax=Halococcus sp. PRR34 TaxID=3020830 RepID=UPI00236064A1|nr:SRPBCC family protein [Halococcus sp. PRR34]
MSTYERETYVRAPFEDVWRFHSTLDGLEALTPEFMNLRVESSRGPDGEPDPDVLEAGAEADLSMRPCGVGPRQGWTTRIIERDREDGAGLFRDEMIGGPFRRWVHTHSFYADGGGTYVRDRVEYQLPLGDLGRLAGPFAVVGFEPMFRYRHRETKKLLE